MTENRKKLVELKNVSLTFNEGKKNEVCLLYTSDAADE